MGAVSIDGKKSTGKGNRVDPFGHRWAHPRHTAAAVRMTCQDEVLEPLEADHAEHVGDVQRGIDARVKQVRPLAKAGERWREHDMSASSQPIGDTSPGPASVPRAVHEDESLRIH